MRDSRGSVAQGQAEYIADMAALTVAAVGPGRHVLEISQDDLVLYGRQYPVLVGLLMGWGW